MRAILAVPGKAGAAGKVPVFGILKRGGKVYTVMIPRVVPDSIVYTDSYSAYDVLDVSEAITIGLITHTLTRANATITSMGSRISRARLSAPSAATTASRKPISTSFSKRPSSTSTTEPQASNCAASNAGPHKQTPLGQPLILSQTLRDSQCNEAVSIMRGSTTRCQLFGSRRGDPRGDGAIVAGQGRRLILCSFYVAAIFGLDDDTNTDSNVGGDHYARAIGEFRRLVR
jgi:hypothetical protein